jgi:ribokinase
MSSWINKHETIWPNVAGSFVQIARSANVPVVLDAGGADTLVSQELLKCVTVLRVNEGELARLTGMETNNLDQITVAAMSILQLVR